MASNQTFDDYVEHHLPTKAPSKLLLFTEGGRAAIELGLYAATRKILNNAPKGDGHPVLVLPGFMTSDRSTILLRKFIRDLGYDVKKWDMGLNLGGPEYAFKIADRVEEISAECNAKVSLVGWSLGGVYAREVARQRPDDVRQVITLGSPFGGIFEKNNARWFYDFLHGPKGLDISQELLKDILLPPPVPSTAIFTKEDGVVNWQHCIERQESDTTQNVQIGGSHFGLGHNPSALYCIADRLSKDINEWERFNPQGMLRYLYPNFNRN